MRNIVLMTTMMALCACSTPTTVMKNDKTGQIVLIGGTATGSALGGFIGYDIQEASEKQQVNNYKQHGFHVEGVRQ